MIWVKRYVNSKANNLNTILNIIFFPKLPLLRKVMKDHSSPVSTLLHDAVLAKEKYPTSYDNHLWEVDLESRKNGSIAIGRPDLVGMVHKGQSRAASEQKKSLSPLKRRAH